MAETFVQGYPTELPLAEIRYLSPLLKGSLIHDKARAILAARNIVSYGLGVAFPASADPPPMLSEGVPHRVRQYANPAGVMTAEDAGHLLEAIADECKDFNKVQKAGLAAQIPWKRIAAALLPFLLDLLAKS